MGTKSREVIWGSRIGAAKITAEAARQRAKEAIREAYRAAWSIRMEGNGGPAQPSPTIGQCLSGGLGWLKVECNRCKAWASLPRWTENVREVSQNSDAERAAAIATGGDKWRSAVAPGSTS